MIWKTHHIVEDICNQKSIVCSETCDSSYIGIDGVGNACQCICDEAIRSIRPQLAGKRKYRLDLTDCYEVHEDGKIQ